MNFFTCNFTCKDSGLAVLPPTSAAAEAVQVIGSAYSRALDTVEVCGSSPHGPTIHGLR